MSESTEPLKFDPESVERWNTGSDVIDACIEGTPLEMVSASDYDSLLSLYRELLSTCEIAQPPRPL